VDSRRAIVVLGAGPAGAASALGLAPLGFDVCVVAAPSPRPRRESFSPRVVEALRRLGLREALAALEPAAPRLVRWAGSERALTGEAQVERARFDAGLVEDLAAHGVRVLRDEVVRVAAGDAVRVELASGGVLAADFAIEARGRAAPAEGARERGPETTCLVQRFRGAPAEARLAVLSLAGGWLWLARDARGRVAAQLALAAQDAPARSALAASLDAALRGDALAAELLGDARPDGAPFARAATPILAAAPAHERLLRVGDAALAVDPLSGNGVFQTLSTALVAPAVVNTLLRAPERAALAREFYAARARDVFLRFARVSRDFYASGAAHHGGAFWRERAAWPDALPAEPPGGPPTLARRPVVCDGFVAEREVVVSAARPLGVWRVAGVEVAPLVRALQADAADAGRIVAAIPPAARPAVESWLRAHGLVPSA
jgi:flavin-dependent dehydrogenase